VAKDEIELRKLKEYQGNIEQVDKQEARLAELNAEIKELSFGKDPRDKAKLSALRGEKINTQNRINILDKRLLRMEAAKPLQRIVEVERGKVAQRERQKARESLDAKSENRKKLLSSIRSGTSKSAWRTTSVSAYFQISVKDRDRSLSVFLHNCSAFFHYLY